MRLMRTPLCVLAAAALLSGCASKSPLHIFLDAITGDSNGAVRYLESDRQGSSGACNTIQDPAYLWIRVESPSNSGINPSLSYATLDRIDLSYSYFDPTTGGTTMRPMPEFAAHSYPGARLPAGQVTSVGVVAVTFDMKYWTYETTGAYTTSGRIALAPLAGITAPTGLVDHILMAVSIYATDGAGQQLSASGNMHIYVNNYAPAPTASDSCSQFIAP